MIDTKMTDTDSVPLDLGTVKELLQNPFKLPIQDLANRILQRANATARDTLGNTILHHAAISGNTPVLMALLESPYMKPVIDMLVNACNTKGRTPLHHAARKGVIEGFKALMQHGADKNALDKNGVHSFHFAARSGVIEVMEAVEIDNVNIKTIKDQLTALHFAARHGHKAAVEWLLQKSARVGETDVEGNTPLHYAVVIDRQTPITQLQQKWKAQTDVTHLLIMHQAKLCSKNKQNNMPVTYSWGANMILAILSSSVDISQTAVNVDVGETDKYGKSILHYAAGHASVAVMKWLSSLTSPESPVEPSPSKDTLLHCAAREGNIETAKFLLDKKRDDLNAPNEEMMTPILLALFQNHKDLFEFLFTYPEVFISCNSVCKALKCELKREKDKGLPEGFDDLLPTYLALYLHKDHIFNFLLERGRMHINLVDSAYGRTCLHCAVLHGRIDLVGKIGKMSGLRPNKEDKEGKAALQYAVERKKTDIEKELLQIPLVKEEKESLYKDRQVYVDAANAILVGAVLIGSVTYGGWLQPPLNYEPYYGIPLHQFGAPPGTYESYAAVEEHAGVRVFWACNSLSFFFAMASVLAGTGAVLPLHNKYIREVVGRARVALVGAATLMVCSVVFVLCAFSAAGFADLPPISKYQANMRGTVAVGGIPCFILMLWFFSRLYGSLPPWSSYFRQSVLSVWQGATSSSSLSLEKENGISDDTWTNKDEKITSHSTNLVQGDDPLFNIMNDDIEELYSLRNTSSGWEPF